MPLRPLSSLLLHVKKRPDLSRRLASTHITEVANHLLSTILPKEHVSLAKVLVYKDDLLIIGCLHSAISQHIMDHEETILHLLKEQIPHLTIKKICTRIQSSFTYDI